MRRVTAIAVSLAVLFVVHLAPATANQQRIVNGLLTHDFPTTGILMNSNNPASAGLSCSGTMIGCETFLTAAHCVEGNLNPSSYLVFLQHAGFLTVTNVAIHSSYSFPVADVAVLKLGTAVDGISPTPIDTAGGHANGTTGTICGFGRSGGNGAGSSDYGLKRVGDVEIAACSGVSNTTSIFLVLQWFTIRLQRTINLEEDGTWSHCSWELLHGIVPLSGWWSGYRRFW